MHKRSESRKQIEFKITEHAFRFADQLVREMSDNRCYCVRAECAEHGSNSAIYEGDLY